MFGFVRIGGNGCVDGSFSRKLMFGHRLDGGTGIGVRIDWGGMYYIVIPYAE